MSDPVTKIATLTPTSAVASFTSIPSTYDDLVLIGSAKHGYTSSSVYSANNVHINMNSDTGSNYSWSGLGARSGESSYNWADGSTLTTFMAVFGCSTNAQAYDNYGWGNFYIYFPGYKVTNAYKKMQSMAGYANSAGNSHGSQIGQGTWGSNAAITSIAVQAYYGGQGSYVTGTSMTLYGISNS